MKQNFKKKENGITLVALVITIIVLLILAMVSISLVINSNIITKSQEVSDIYNQSAKNEINELNDFYTEMAGKIDEIGGTGGVDETGKGNWKIGEDKNTVTNGSITLDIGEYVDYTPGEECPENYSADNLTDTYTGSTNNGTAIKKDNLTWQVFGVDENNNLLLISSNKTSQNIYFKGARGYNNGVYIMNDICKTLYSNADLGVEARNLTIEDIERGFSEAGRNARDTYINTSSNTQYNNAKDGGYESPKNQYPVLYAEEEKSGVSGTIREGGISQSDAYYKSREELTAKSEKESDTAAGKLNCTQTYYYWTKDASSGYYESPNFYNLIHPSSGYYWLASRYVNCNSDYAGFGLRYVYSSDLRGLGMFYSDGSDGSGNNALRPAVSLKSNISVDSDQTHTGEINDKHTIK